MIVTIKVKNEDKEVELDAESMFKRGEVKIKPEKKEIEIYGEDSFAFILDFT